MVQSMPVDVRSSLKQIPVDSLLVRDLLEADSRPTFVIHSTDIRGVFDVLHPCYVNPALRKLHRAQEELFFRPSDNAALQDFANWACNQDVGRKSTYQYCSIEWHRTWISDKWLVIGATTEPVSSQSRVANSTDMMYPQWKYSDDLDWTKTTNIEQLPDYVQYLRRIDWSKTDFGPMSQWPTELRVVFNTMMRSKSPTILHWGENICTIYNEAYIPVVGDKHPAFLGARLEDLWPVEFEAYYNLIFKDAYEFGIEMPHENPHCLMLNARGIVEERYFNFEMLPVIGPSTKNYGNTTVLLEVTESVLTQRRLHTTLAISQLYRNTITVEDLWRGLLDALEASKEDVPFATLYSMEHPERDAPLSDCTQIQSDSAMLHLVGSVGVAEEAVPNRIRFEDSTDPITKALKAANGREQQILLSTQDGTLPKSLADAILPERGHGAGCEQAILFPLKMTNHDATFGFLLVGLNRRCPYDEDYKRFLSLLSAQFSSALAATVTHQEELKRRKNQADLEQAVLKAKLAEQNREVQASERRFKQLIDNAVTAICISRTDGSLAYVNKKWTELYGGTEADLEEMAWINRIWAEDKETAMQYFSDVAHGLNRGEVEIRLNKLGHDTSVPSMSMPYTWVLVSGYAEIGEDGAVEYLVGVSIDITHQKWVQGESQRRAAEATEAKRRQDAFTDMVAHEIRNPLNAIMQCSDVIQEAMTALQNGDHDPQKVSESMENAETISHCAAHQKKIVNDLLTLSKLDSDLLTFTPVSSRPEKLLQQAIRIFESGSKQHDIALTYRIDPTVAQQNVNWMLLDADRTLQILINLITNAIKFTSGRPTRSVTVSLSAATDCCTFARDYGIRFFPSKRTRTGDSHSNGDIFLLFSVEDTGRGISTAEEKRLFHRFSQASLRTHVDFGGSGLGLWISRELTEMQGGEIGFVPGKQDGSLFAFYVRTQHTESPNTIADRTDLLMQTNNDVSSLERRMSHALINGICAPKTNGLTSKMIDLSSVTILLTEDNIVNQKVMKKQLAKCCKEVLIANHGKEALDLLEASRHQSDTTSSNSHVNGGHSDVQETGKIDLILMDIEMPVMNGIECTSRIRELESLGSSGKRIPIIAISANARVEQLNEYKEAGMDEVLSKPFLIKDLLAVVKRLL